jgi:putative endonuclease
LYSLKLDKYYIGSTQDVFTRLDNHNVGKSISTKAGAPWSLKYTEEFVTCSEAVKREQEIKKKKSRRYIEWLISSVG